MWTTNAFRWFQQVTSCCATTAASIPTRGRIDDPIGSAAWPGGPVRVVWALPGFSPCAAAIDPPMEDIPASGLDESATGGLEGLGIGDTPRVRCGSSFRDDPDAVLLFRFMDRCREVVGSREVDGGPSSLDKHLLNCREIENGVVYRLLESSKVLAVPREAREEHARSRLAVEYSALDEEDVISLADRYAIPSSETPFGVEIENEISTEDRGCGDASEAAAQAI